MLNELAADDLAWRCPEDWLPWQTSAEIEPATTIVGQERAVEAIAFGLAMRGVGYNIFVTGLSGTGRLTTIKRFLDRLAGDEPRPDDVCFVHNFRCPEEPRALFLKAGGGRRLREGLEAMVKELAENLPALFGDKEFRRRVERAVADLQRQERSLIESFEKEVRAAGFSLVQIQAGPVTRPDILPVVGEKPVAVDELNLLVDQGALSAEDAQRFRDLYAKFSEQLHELFEEVGELRQQMQERVESARGEVIQPLLDVVVDRVRKSVDDERVDPYLDALREDLQENLGLFAPGQGEDAGSDRFLRWQANLVVDNADATTRPVVLETEPSYTNIFGTVERTLTQSGESVTNFTRIRAGSLLRANGGFLVLNADDVLFEPRVWQGLKRALKFRRAQIQTLESVILGAALLKPEPVPIDVKVVVIGDRRIYDLLYRFDPDFPKIFKALADFDSVMPRTAETAGDVLTVLRKVSVEEDLPPMDRSGMASMLEQAVSMGHWRRRFSSVFSDLADLLREAAFKAGKAGADKITREHVLAAQAAYRHRHGLSEDRTHEFITDGVVHVDTDGSVVGQVNGLAVYDLGHHRFGKPSRITARLGLGRDGVINIERQAGLSGPTHDKGVQILTGFLRGVFAQAVPLNMSCSITFEQSYGGIDGDSASSTEVYAILSALSGVAIRQDVAVTGSVDQYGRVQAIGGVNEKVEGFFRVCSTRGLTGSQGVLVPASNAADLHVGQEVVDAVREGRFHVWTVDTVEEGMKLLTGRDTGERTAEGGWTEGSLYELCQQRLDEMVRLMRQAGKDGGNATEKTEEPPASGEDKE